MVSLSAKHMHVLLPCSIMEWLSWYENGALVPPPLPQCAMKLIIAMEIMDSHSNLDIFQGHGQDDKSVFGIRYQPLPPLTFILSLHLGPLVFNLYYEHVCRSLPVCSLSSHPLDVSLYLSVTSFFMGLLETPSLFLLFLLGNGYQLKLIEPSC